LIYLTAVDWAEHTEEQWMNDFLLVGFARSQTFRFCSSSSSSSLYKTPSSVYLSNVVVEMIPVPPWKFLGRSAGKGTGIVVLVMVFCIGRVSFFLLLVVFRCL
jgi:RsiW-degrading membrane proteinase PrsW (M82 family)